MMKLFCRTQNDFEMMEGMKTKLNPIKSVSNIWHIFVLITWMSWTVVWENLLYMICIYMWLWLQPYPHFIESKPHLLLLDFWVDMLLKVPVPAFFWVGQLCIKKDCHPFHDHETRSGSQLFFLKELLKCRGPCRGTGKSPWPQSMPSSCTIIAIASLQFPVALHWLWNSKYIWKIL